MLYYFESDRGCGIRYGTNPATVRNEILREVGTYSGVKNFRKATKKDMAWVDAMGGHVPDDKNNRHPG